MFQIREKNLEEEWWDIEDSFLEVVIGQWEEWKEDFHLIDYFKLLYFNRINKWIKLKLI